MKEEDAKKRWCMQAKSPYPAETYCIASKCMMWVDDYIQLESVMDVAGPMVKDGGHCGQAK